MLRAITYNHDGTLQPDDAATGWLDGWFVDRWMDGWMDEWIDEKVDEFSCSF
jgi:hypothetical protein